jgi:predicted nucleic acid-binding protein
VRTLIVDASVAVKWLVLEDMSNVAKELYAAGDRLVAPRLITTEIANALARKTMQGLLNRHEAKYHLSSLPQFLPDLIEVDELIEPAFENACVLRHPVYDLIYLEAARRLDAQLVTADRRFVTKIAGTDFARSVMMLSDWRPE